MQNRTFALSLSALSVVAFGASGCSILHLAKKSNNSSGTTTASAASTDEPSMRDQLLHSVPEVQVVHFDYDRSDLRDDQRSILEQNAKWLRAHSNLKIQVAGHCDERGTEAYNLALGQRRARTIRQQYTYLGVLPGQIATISYGKEKPLCAESTEDCWSQNRRAETLVAFPQDIGSAQPTERTEYRDAVKNK